MRMVREGENPKRVLAVCCKVEVVNGGRAARDCCDSLIALTLQVPVRAAFTMASASDSVFGSSTQMAVNTSVFPPEADPPRAERSALTTQNFSGTKARISRSRSMSMRKAGDCTRPADNPYLTFFQINPDKS